jgi:hypothetical protein
MSGKGGPYRKPCSATHPETLANTIFLMSRIYIRKTIVFCTDGGYDGAFGNGFDRFLGAEAKLLLACGPDLNLAQTKN